MKPFRFRLETVLALRTREEDRVREEFAGALRNQSAAAAALATGNSELEACHESLASRRAEKTNRTEQLLLLSALQQQKSNCERLVARCAATDREVAARRADLLIVRRKREALTRLREHQRAAHLLEQDRQQEAQIADIISARHVLRMQEAQS